MMYHWNETFETAPWLCIKQYHNWRPYADFKKLFSSPKRITINVWKAIIGKPLNSHYCWQITITFVKQKNCRSGEAAVLTATLKMLRWSNETSMKMFKVFFFLFLLFSFLSENNLFIYFFIMPKNSTYFILLNVVMLRKKLVLSYRPLWKGWL